MLRFRRNKSLAGRQTILLLVYLLTFLYFLSGLVHMSGERLYWGAGTLALWIFVVISWDVRMLFHCLDWIELRDDAVCVRHFRKKLFYYWSHVKEEELRERVGVLEDRYHLEQVVISNIELSDAIRKQLCSDVDPWLFRKQLAEFSLEGQEKEADIRLQLGQQSKWLSTALENAEFQGLSIFTKDASRHISYSNLLFFCSGSCLFSWLRMLVSACWYLAVITTFDRLSQPIFQMDNMTKGIWIVCLILSFMRLLWRICIKVRLSRLS